MKKVFFKLFGVLLSMVVAFGATAQKLSEDELANAEKAKQVALMQSKPQAKTEGFRLMQKQAAMPALALSKAMVYSEDFEGVTGEGELPAGWTSIATPGVADDVWLAGANQSYPAHSGNNYLVKFYDGNNAHDCWAFTPAIALDAGQQYNISFWVRLVGYGGAFEALDVNIGNEPAVAAMTTQIYDESGVNDAAFRKVTYSFTPTAAGDYYIGFHSYSPADVNVTMVDDIVVETPIEGPGFAGETTLAMGAFYDFMPVKRAIYAVSNPGTEALTLSLASKSDELTVDVPASVAAGASADITVDLTTTTVGAYTGNFVLTTNDPANESVTVEVTATVNTAPVTGYQYQQFETAPANWTFSGLSQHSGSGIDGSASYRGNPYVIFGYPIPVQAITNFISMGDAPRVKFYYKALGYNSPDAALANDVALIVAVSTDGTNYTTEHVIAPGETNQHTSSTDYAFVDVDLSAYANQICKVAIQASPASASANYHFYIDNMSVGTPLANDLVAASITGNATPSAEEEAVYTVAVLNAGTATQSSYTVKLMQVNDGGDIMLGEANGVAIASNETKTFEFTWTPAAEGNVQLYGEVVLTDDEEATNNKTSNLNVVVQPSGITGITIGEGTVKAYLPVNFYWNKSAIQTLYYASEMGTNGGTINSIAFKSSFNAAYKSAVPVQVWIGETDKANFADTAWIDVASLTKIHDDTLSLPAGDSDWIISLDTPYEYHGGNLVIYTVKVDASFELNKFFYNTVYAGSSRTLDAHFDTGDMTPETPGTGTVSHQAPNVTFFMSMEGMGGVSGVVSDAEGVKEGVKVEIVGTQLYAMTNAEGAYSFPNLMPDDYTLKATMFGYADAETEVTIVADETQTVDITIVELPKVTVSGTVSRSDNGEPVDGATVALAGFDNFETTTGTDGGYVIENVWANNKYAATVSADGFVTFEDSVTVGAVDLDADFTLNETPAPPKKVTAEPSGANMLVKWYNPWTDMGGEPKTYTLDDGTFENGYTMPPSTEASLGNIYTTTDAGYIQSIDVYAVNNTDNSGRLVTAQVFNDAHELLGTSAEFTYPAESWFNVTLPDIEYSGNFYVMIHWPATTGSNHYLGLDNNGPSAGAASATYYWDSEDGWMTMQAATGNPAAAGAYMIRVNAMVTGEAKSYGVDTNPIAKKSRRTMMSDIHAISMEHAIPVEAGNPVVSVPSSSPKAFVNYSVYRLLDGQQSDETAWTTVAETVTDTTYTDNGWDALEGGVYRYAVKAHYTNLVSNPAFSEKLPKDMEVPVTVNLTTNSGDEVAGAMLTLVNEDGDSDHTYSLGANSNIVIFPAVWKGTYELAVSKAGFAKHTETIVVDEEMAVNVELIEIIETPYGLKVEETDNDNDRLFSWNNMPDKVEVTVTVGDVWGDGTGYQLLLDSTATEFGVTIPENEPIASCAAATPTLYDVFSHKLPENADPVCTTQNILINTTVSIFVDPGTYDFCFANPSPSTDPQLAQIWIASGEYGRRDDFMFEAGKKYTFTISLNQSVGYDQVVLTVEDAVKNNETKSFAGYTVYLDEEKIEEGLTDTQYKFTGLANGTYTAGVQVVYSSGESEIVYSEPFDVDVSGIESNTLSDIRLYPNPFTDEITVSNPAAIRNIEITNVTGQKVKEVALSGKTISTGELSSGVYFVTIETITGEKAVYKMVKK